MPCSSRTGRSSAIGARISKVAFALLDQIAVIDVAGRIVSDGNVADPDVGGFSLRCTASSRSAADLRLVRERSGNTRMGASIRSGRTHAADDMIHTHVDPTRICRTPLLSIPSILARDHVCGPSADCAVGKIPLEAPSTEVTNQTAHRLGRGAGDLRR